VEIRILEEDDAARYWAVRLRALREEPEAFGSSYAEVVDRPLAAVAERLRPRLEPPQALTLGAFVAAHESATRDSLLTGIVTCTREERHKVAHKATITGMYVAPEARGQGIGRALLHAALARARGWDGVEQVMLSVVSTNAAALGLYTALGFEPFGHETHALKLDGRYLDEDYLVHWLRRHDDTPRHE
jgi:ribosomal protein S18 acetylase RimI-like enzyme